MFKHCRIDLNPILGIVLTDGVQVNNLLEIEWDFIMDLFGKNTEELNRPHFKGNQDSKNLIKNIIKIVKNSQKKQISIIVLASKMEQDYRKMETFIRIFQELIEIALKMELIFETISIKPSIKIVVLVTKFIHSEDFDKWQLFYVDKQQLFRALKQKIEYEAKVEEIMIPAKFGYRFYTIVELIKFEKNGIIFFIKDKNYGAEQINDSSFPSYVLEFLQGNEISMQVLNYFDDKRRKCNLPEREIMKEIKIWLNYTMDDLKKEIQTKPIKGALRVYEIYHIPSCGALL